MADSADHPIDFTRLPHPSPVSAEARERAISDPGFGKVFSDHMVSIDWDEDRGWHGATLGPRGPLSLDPACAFLHFALLMFDGLMA
jgi:branched-chain amino acid aminotransferase